MRGWRRGSPATGGCRSTRRQVGLCPSVRRRPRCRSTAPRRRLRRPAEDGPEASRACAFPSAGSARPACARIAARTPVRPGGTAGARSRCRRCWRSPHSRQAHAAAARPARRSCARSPPEDHVVRSRSGRRARIGTHAAGTRSSARAAVRGRRQRVRERARAHGLRRPRRGRRGEPRAGDRTVAERPACVARARAQAARSLLRAGSQRRASWRAMTMR